MRTGSDKHKNKKETEKVREVDIQKFTLSDFRKEYHDLIPNLTQEFVLPKELTSLCNAVHTGDSRATLFHGPAGT